MQSSSASPLSLIFPLIWLVIAVVAIAGMWKTYQKAGKPGWAVLIPIYNVYVLLQIIGKPWWWLLLMLIPFVNIVISILVALEVAKVFGRSTVFGIVGLWLFSIIGYLILGFGSSQYQGPSGSTSVPMAQPMMPQPAPAAAEPAPAAPMQ